MNFILLLNETIANSDCCMEINLLSKWHMLMPDTDCKETVDCCECAE